MVLVWERSICELLDVRLELGRCGRGAEVGPAAMLLPSAAALLLCLDSAQSCGTEARLSPALSTCSVRERHQWPTDDQLQHN